MLKVRYKDLEHVTEETKAEARRNMNGSELRLFLYLMDSATKAGEEWFYMDKVDVIDYYGIGQASFQRALNGLKDKGYLRKRTNSNTYYFSAVGGLTK